MMSDICSSTTCITSASTLFHSVTGHFSPRIPVSPPSLNSSRFPDNFSCLVTSSYVEAQAQLGARSRNTESRDIKLCFLAITSSGLYYRLQSWENRKKEVETKIIFQPDEQAERAKQKGKKRKPGKEADGRDGVPGSIFRRSALDPVHHRFHITVDDSVSRQT